MSSLVLSKSYTEPPICEKNILRYAGCRESDRETSQLLRDCINEAVDKLVYKVCYSELTVKTEGSICDFEAFQFCSEKLALNLDGCEKAVVFAATVGVGIDRLIARYSRLSPSKALLLQAIGAERIEALCDAFCAEIAKEYNMGIKPRFSPGYGDLSLDTQKDIFALLNCEKRIGLTLTDSLLMSPSKSVTAIIGIGGKKTEQNNKCGACNMKNCAFRGAL